MTNRKTAILLGVGLIIIAAAWTQLSDKIGQPAPNEKVRKEGEIKKEAVLVIDDGTGVFKSFTGRLEEGMTAFGLLKMGTKELNVNLEFKNYDVGVFVEKIGEKKNGDNAKYWLYYVNGEMPMVAADKLQIKQGDRVEFKFEKSKF